MIIRWLSRWTTYRWSQLCRRFCQRLPQDYNATATLESLTTRAATCLVFPSFFFIFFRICCPLNSPERLLYLPDFIPVYSLSCTSSHMVFFVQWLCDHSIAQRWKLHVKIHLSIFLSSFKRVETIKAEGDWTNTHKPPSWINTYYWAQAEAWVG